MLFWRDNTLFVIRTFDGMCTWLFLVFTLGLTTSYVNVISTELAHVVTAICAIIYFSVRLMIHTYRLIFVLYGTSYSRERLYVMLSLLVYPFLLYSTILKRVKNTRRMHHEHSP